MARKAEPGISFYRMNCNHVLNKKVRLLMNEFGSNGYWIWQCIISSAYIDKGYFFDTSDKDALELFATDVCRKQVSLVNEVIAGCVRRGLFDEAVFNMFGVLTSQMMQEVYLEATSERRRKGTKIELIEHYILCEVKDTDENVSIVPVNNSFLPRKNSIDPRNNPQSRVDKSKEEKSKVVVAPVAPSEPSVDKKTKRFVAPAQEEVKAYFLQIAGNTKNQRCWPADKCANQAAEFFDHYTANGWVQGRGKPIKDWHAAVRNWIRHEVSGVFSAPAAKPEKTTPAPVMQPAPDPVNPIIRDINYLYERFLENQITIISVETMHYDFLKRAGMISFTDKEVQQIQQNAQTHEPKAETDQQIRLRFMKLFGVLEFFEQLKRQKRTEVFHVD